MQIYSRISQGMTKLKYLSKDFLWNQHLSLSLHSAGNGTIIYRTEQGPGPYFQGKIRNSTSWDELHTIWSKVNWKQWKSFSWLWKAYGQAVTTEFLELELLQIKRILFLDPDDSQEVPLFLYSLLHLCFKVLGRSLPYDPTFSMYFYILFMYIKSHSAQFSHPNLKTKACEQWFWWQISV